MPTPDTLLAARDALLAADRVLITTHVRPDGDALGSQIALGLFLKGLGKTVTLLNADPAPRTLDWLLGETTEPEVYEPGTLGQAQALQEADVVCVVDTGADHRLGDLGPLVKTAPGTKVLIDHHPDPDGWFDLAHVDATSASTGELVYELIRSHSPDAIDTPIATALYTAIVTDTGLFRFPATTAHTHRVAADLMERGALKIEDIHVALYDSRRMGGLRLLGMALGTIGLHHGGRVATMQLTQQMLRDAGARFDESEGFVNYALSIEGVQAAVIFLETPSGTKASFRSKGAVAVNAWAAQFGGGGHRNAAGAFLTDRGIKRAHREVLAATPEALRDVATDGNALGDHADLEALKKLFEAS